MQAAANAGVILYSDLGPDGSLYNCCVGPFPGIGGGPPPLGPYTKGFGFSAATGGIVEEIDLPFWGMPNLVTVSLNADADGSPGAVLDSWNILPSGVDWTTCCTVETLIPHEDVALTAGAPYWLVAGPATGQMTFAGFFLNDVGALGLSAISNNGGAFAIAPGSTLAAFQVTGSVPEPGSFVPVGSMLAAAIGLRKRCDRRAPSARRNGN